MKRTVGIVALAVSLAACLFALGCAGETGSADNAITVEASGSASIAPDKASIGITLEGIAEIGEDAEETAAQAVAALTQNLKTYGLAEADIQSGEVETEPHYESGGTSVQGIPTGYYDYNGFWVDTGTQQITSYIGDVLSGNEWKVHVNVQAIPAALLSQVIRDAVNEGATGFDALTFTMGSRDEAYQQALSQAVDAAHEKAELLAQASGVYVGRLVNLAENIPAEPETTVVGNADAIVIGDETTYDVVSAVSVPVEATVVASYAIS